eukprot:CAMPEP_0114238366 /NCGR_PEP_ID=MMETSP0058-20121206/7888_1 /TAXON_ID=36894 /ORGANISM="Pyramimonas parkeae, CCMP726" /LENGTH=61 /DNA_ID=CAMNT_0001350475 /DNA_START=37 /DNA_END=222 /DNA_ORIENTATION=+
MKLSTFFLCGAATWVTLLQMDTFHEYMHERRMRNAPDEELKRKATLLRAQMLKESELSKSA